MVRKNAATNPLVLLLLALLMGAAGRAEPAFATRLAQFLGAGMAEHSVKALGMRAADQTHAQLALAPAGAAAAGTVLPASAHTAPYRQAGLPAARWLAHADRAPPASSIRHC